MTYDVHEITNLIIIYISDVREMQEKIKKNVQIGEII